MAPRKPVTRAGAVSAATTRCSARLDKRAPSPATATHRPVTDNKRRITRTKATPKPKPKPLKYDCTTCGRNLAASSFPKYAIAESCDHLINTCKACVKQWVNVQLEMTTYDKLSCPQCPSTMINEDVQRAAAPKVYQRFVEMERRALQRKCLGGAVHEPLRRNPELAKPKVTGTKTEEEGEDDMAIVSPEAWEKVRKANKEANTIDLEAMDEERFINVKSGKRKLRSQKTPHPKDGTTHIKSPKKPLPEIDSDTICMCNTCNASACVSCDRPYHESETCAQYQGRRKRQTETEEKASETLIGKKCKHCPKCKKNIEKNGGCDMVTCTQCYTNFCWRCELDYVEIRKTGHGRGCAYARQGAIDPHNMQAAMPLPMLPPVFFGGGGPGQMVGAALNAALAWGGGGPNDNGGNANR
ncbi:hypothetical protein LTR78_003110 [Recurvomyces mirabilis]|uniref:RING-type domain-containing protein n=1 Tax=Recurvomyces mirabilis TaxID=574656 RepID=A0AAE0WSC7_9PEZI|nr:hypothetical protein LTR78_003110 [Recurvomyces mirabilis]KAK5157068.1 hypothetical protein LTS14_004586 [Recurvomyces mirabilis]